MRQARSRADASCDRGRCIDLGENTQGSYSDTNWLTIQRNRARRLLRDGVIPTSIGQFVQDKAGRGEPLTMGEYALARTFLYQSGQVWEAEGVQILVESAITGGLSAVARRAVAEGASALLARSTSRSGSARSSESP